MYEKFKLKIVTPETIMYDDYVNSILLRSTLGNMQVLKGMNNNISVLDTSFIKCYIEDSVTIYAVSNGVLKVETENGNTDVTIIADEIIKQDDIDITRAENRISELEKLISKESDEKIIRALEKKKKVNSNKIEVAKMID